MAVEDSLVAAVVGHRALARQKTLYIVYTSLLKTFIKERPPNLPLPETLFAPSAKERVVRKVLFEHACPAVVVV